MSENRRESWWVSLVSSRTGKDIRGAEFWTRAQFEDFVRDNMEDFPWQRQSVRSFVDFVYRTMHRRPAYLRVETMDRRHVRLERQAARLEAKKHDAADRAAARKYRRPPGAPARYGPSNYDFDHNGRRLSGTRRNS